MAVENDVLMKLGVEEAKSLSGAWDNIGGQMTGLLAKGAAWGAALISVGAIVKGLYSGFKMAAEEYMQTADAAARLTAGLDGMARVHPILKGHVAGMTATLVDQANAMSRTTSLSDNEAMALQRQAMNYGILADRIDATVRAAIDFAAAAGIDAHTALMRLSQASNGVYMGWNRWGITVDETKSSLENFDSILQQVNARFGGAAQAEMKTYAGQLKELDKAWQDMWKSAGNKPAAIMSWFREMKMDLYKAITDYNNRQGKSESEITAILEERKSREAAAVAVNAQADATRRLVAEEARLAVIRENRRAIQSDEAAMVKRWAEDEKNSLQRIIDLERTLLTVKDQQANKAKDAYSRLARERGMMSPTERRRAESIYGRVEEGGVGAWEGMTPKQREWYAGTAIGRQQLAKKGIFEAQADVNAPWLKSAAGATTMQIDAAVKNEIVVKVAGTDKDTEAAIIGMTVDKMKEYFEEKRKDAERNIETFMKKYGDLQASSAATGGGK